MRFLYLLLRVTDVFAGRAINDRPYDLEGKIGKEKGNAQRGELPFFALFGLLGVTLGLLLGLFEDQEFADEVIGYDVGNRGNAF